MHYKILLHCLTHKSHSLRSATRRRVSKMIRSLGGSQMSLAFVHEFRHLLATLKVSFGFWMFVTVTIIEIRRKFLLCMISGL